MKKVISVTLFTLSTISGFPEEVILKVDMPDKIRNFEIPVNVHLDSDNMVRIEFKREFRCQVIVTGPDGIVYQKSINAKNYQTVLLDLKPYQEGDYEITFYDKDGNVIDGSFYLKNRFNNPF